MKHISLFYELSNNDTHYIYISKYFFFSLEKNTYEVPDSSCYKCLLLTGGGSIKIGGSTMGSRSGIVRRGGGINGGGLVAAAGGDWGTIKVRVRGFWGGKVSLKDDMGTPMMRRRRRRRNSH